MRVQPAGAFPSRDPGHFPRWTQGEHDEYDSWLGEYMIEAENSSQTLHPAVKELQDRIRSSTRLTQLAQGMYDELAFRPLPPSKKVPFHVNIADYQHMLRSLNYFLTVPILWNSYRYLIGWTSCPILSIFWRPLHTTCGFAFFQDPEVNMIMKKILDKWGEYLRSTESAWCLDDGPRCWFSPEALTHLVSEANAGNDLRLQSFEEIYICDRSKPRYGFTSWDNFFTRRFREGVRPLAYSDDNSVIVHACESTPRRIQRNVQESDKFWTKGTPYSLTDMLNHDSLSSQFCSGTVYQAYLSALSYHRWHAPVSGRVVRATLIQGFYFSEPPYDGFNPEYNPNGEEKLTWDNAYQTAVATRALIFIEADNSDIGLMAALFVGMTEVSTCEIAVKDGDTVRKGDEIGSFHCGGSTYCLIFRQGVNFFDLPDPSRAKHIHPVRGFLARVRKTGEVQ